MASHSAPRLYVCLCFILHILTSTLAQSDNYIVYMDLSAMPKAFSGQHSWYSATLQSLSKTTTTTDVLSSSKLLYSYNHVINGFSASLTPAEHEAVKSSPGNSSLTDLPIVFMDQCHNLTQLRQVGEKIVVCEDKDGSSLYDQVINISRAKVAGAVFISDYKDLGILLQITTFAAMFMNSKNGEIIKGYIKNNSTEPKGRIEFKKTNVGTKPAPTVTSYSSRGPSQSCPYVLKPDIMAPGDFILAAWPPNLSVAELPMSEGMSTYTASVTLPVKGFKVSVVPDQLVFKGKYEKQSYKPIYLSSGITQFTRSFNLQKFRLRLRRGIFHSSVEIASEKLSSSSSSSSSSTLSTEQNSSSSNNNNNNSNKALLDFKETELRLGLPGSKSAERKPTNNGVSVSLFGKDIENSSSKGCSLSPLKNIVSGAKRGFSDAIDGSSANWGLSMNGKSEADLCKGTVLYSPRGGGLDEKNKIIKETSVLPQSTKAAQEKKKNQLPASNEPTSAPAAK
ncbi:hypothetical protein Q3G72_027472 [Acer saccharum]|nr:hypothetical protein Q3G72_027472 [Acer saccharum]